MGAVGYKSWVTKETSLYVRRCNFLAHISHAMSEVTEKKVRAKERVILRDRLLEGRHRLEQSFLTLVLRDPYPGYFRCFSAS